MIESTTPDVPTVTDIRRHNGIAGQFSVTAIVTYPGEAPERAEFVGNSYGGPVVMIMPSGNQTFVSSPERFGSFANDALGWVARFFTDPKV